MRRLSTPADRSDGRDQDPAIAFEVLDALDGFCRLTRRSPTLDGSVPLRAAQACVPLLDGNAFGFQVVLTRPVTLRRRLGRWRVELSDGDRRALDVIHAAAVPRLVARRLLDEKSPLGRGGPLRLSSTIGRARLRLWTGLLVRPVGERWLRVARAANRRNALIDVAEAYYPDPRLVPLDLELTVTAATDEVRLEGEIACLAPVQPDVRFTSLSLDEAPELGRAHADFYDEQYFARKRRGAITRRYRQQVSHDPAAVAPGTAACRVAAIVGEGGHRVVRAERFVTAGGPPPRQPLEMVEFDNLIDFRARYDGNTVAIDHREAELEALARPLAARLRAVHGDDHATAHRGALLYLARYFTPHPPGEPHFFVKPWAFTETPPGWSSLVEGIPGDGYDVLRGVIATDQFFATPAVFLLREVGRAVRVAAGQPLLRVIPIPRALLHATFRALPSLAD